MLTGFAIGVASSLVLIIGIYISIKIFRKEDRKLLVERLEANTKRLQDAISELMARANEVDQESKFLEGGLRPELSERLEKACSELVLLGDAVNVIESRILQQDFKSAKSDLLISLGAADNIREEISIIRDEIRQKRISG